MLWRFSSLRHFLTTVISLFFLAGPAVAAPIEDHSTHSASTGAEFCNQVRKDISTGLDAKKVTRDAIRGGQNACPVIQCAISAGGHPQRIIAGAKEAGASSDLVSGCAVDACAVTTRLFESHNFCAVIRDDLAKAQDPRKIVREKIGGGNRICPVIQCAIASGTALREVFAGAKEAGVTSDVISRCSLDACVDPARVAAVEQDLGIYGLGYPYYDEDFVPIDTTVPRGTKDRLLSPSSF